jgi:hypothetical protein
MKKFFIVSFLVQTIMMLIKSFETIKQCSHTPRHKRYTFAKKIGICIIDFNIRFKEKKSIFRLTLAKIAKNNDHSLITYICSLSHIMFEVF